MDTERTAFKAVVVTVAAGRGAALLARETLARAFGLDGDEAELVLARGGATVSPRAEPSRSCLALLRLLGVEAQPLALAGPRYDLSVRLSDPRDPQALAQVESFCPACALDTLEGPAGLVMTDLPAEAARALAVALQRRPGLRVTLAPQAGAVFDLYGPEGFVAPEALRRYLAIIGAGEAPAALAEALAVGLDAQQAARAAARFAALGVVAINRAFQRFDLWVTGTGLLDPREAADFLAARGFPLAGARLDEGGEAAIEGGLTLCDAMRFLNDYGHIGLQVRASLARGGRQNR